VTKQFISIGSIVPMYRLLQSETYKNLTTNTVEYFPMYLT